MVYWTDVTSIDLINRWLTVKPTTTLSFILDALSQTVDIFFAYIFRNSKFDTSLCFDITREKSVLQIVGTTFAIALVFI